MLEHGNHREEEHLEHFLLALTGAMRDGWKENRYVDDITVSERSTPPGVGGGEGSQVFTEAELWEWRWPPRQQLSGQIQTGPGNQNKELQIHVQNNSRQIYTSSPVPKWKLFPWLSGCDGRSILAPEERGVTHWGCLGPTWQGNTLKLEWGHNSSVDLVSYPHFRRLWDQISLRTFKVTDNFKQSNFSELVVG